MIVFGFIVVLKIFTLQKTFESNAAYTVQLYYCGTHVCFDFLTMKEAFQNYEIHLAVIIIIDFFWFVFSVVCTPWLSI